MQIVTALITRNELLQIAQKRFGNMVKAVVDIEKSILIIDADLHADLEAELLHSGSKQEFLWGINLYPEITGADFIEFDSMINVRPSMHNMSRGVDSESIREKIMTIVTSRIA